MPQSSTCFRSLLALSALCAVSAAWVPQALAQSQSTSCTLRAPLDIFSKPKGQGRHTHLSTGAVLEVLNHSGNWYTVYTGSAEAYVAASAFARACPTQSRTSAPHSKGAAADLIDIPLEPVPTAPTGGSPSPPPAMPAAPELKDSNAPPAVPPPAPQLPSEIAPPAPKRTERAVAPPPASYFEPPAPLLGQQVNGRAVWVGVETGLWIGGGAAVLTSGILYIVNEIHASSASTDILAANAATHNNPTAASTTDARNKAQSEADAVHTLNTWTVVTGVVGVAALAAALGLHYWGPQAIDGSASDVNPMAMPMPTLHIGWGSFALEGKF